MSFEEIAKKSYCPFARPSKMGTPITMKTADVETELREHKHTIASFFRDAKVNKHDGMVITFEDESVADTLDALTDLTRRFYLTLVEMYPSVYIQESPDPDQRWYSMIEGEQFFLVSFAPCYPETSPRHTYGDRRTYFLLQPASTFAKNTVAIEKVRQRIHGAFVAAGKPYDAHLANVDNDMFKSIMPISPLDQPVRWWDTQQV